MRPPVSQMGRWFQGAVRGYFRYTASRQRAGRTPSIDRSNEPSFSSAAVAVLPATARVEAALEPSRIAPRDGSVVAGASVRRDAEAHGSAGPRRHCGRVDDRVLRDPRPALTLHSVHGG